MYRQDLEAKLGKDIDDFDFEFYRTESEKKFAEQLKNDINYIIND